MPSPGVTKVINYCESLYSEGKASKDEHSRSWDRYLDFQRGKQWEKGRPKHKSDIVVNITDLVLERNKGLMTDSRPTITVTARHKGLVEHAKILQTVCQALWEEHNVEQRLTKIVGLSSLFGSAGMETDYDPMADNGYGDLSMMVGDPRAYIFDPSVTEAAEVDKGQYYFREAVLPLDVIRERWPGPGALVKQDDTYSSYMPVSASSPIVSRGPRPIKLGRGKSSASAIPKAVVKQIHIRDYRTNEEAQDVQMGNWSIRPGQKLFPGGRKIIYAGDVILVDEPNRFWDCRFPIDWMDWRTELDSPWGAGDVKTLMNLQKNLNKMMGSMMENAVLINGSWVIGDANALTKEQWDSLSGDQPNQIVRKRPGSDLRREPGTAMPGTYLSVVQLLLGLIDQVSGNADVLQGRGKSGFSGAAVDALQIAAQTLIRLRSRTMEAFLVRVFQKVISRIFQFYTTDRLFHLTGPSKHLIEFEFNRKKLLAGYKDPTLAFRDFTFVITPGTSLATTRVQRSVLAGQLFTLGVIDDQALLEAVEWPNADAVRERTQAKKAAGALPATPGKRGRFSQGNPGNRTQQREAATVGNVRGLAGGPAANNTGI